MEVPNKEINVQLQSMFNFGHINWKSLTGKEYVQLVMYFPFGVALLLLRLVLFVVMGFGLIFVPKKFFFSRWMSVLLLPIFGFVVKINRKSKDSLHNIIMVSNHRGSFDVFPFLLETKFIALIDKGFFETNYLAKQFQKVCGAIPIDRSASKASEEKQIEFRNGIRKQLEDSPHPLLVFPEGWDTNGKKGVLVFQKFLFSVGRPIQPVALRVTVPWMPMIEPNVLGTTIIKEVLWLFFVPFFEYELTFLPQQVIKENESPEAFAKRVQEMIAKELRIPATDYTFKDALAVRMNKMKNK